MKIGLSGLKNLIWALGIIFVLLALLVGLIFSFSQKRSGERESGTMVLGETAPREKRSKDGVDGGMAYVGQLNELPSSQKQGLEYVFGMTFLTDRTLSGLADYSINYGDTSATIWSDNGSGLTAADAADTPIIFVDGSMITPANAAMISQPKRLVIYLGADGLAETTREAFIAGYELLINSIRSNSPNTVVIVCSIASVSSNYQGSDGLTPALIAQANEWIRQVCIDTGALYADLASFLNDENGQLRDEYLMPDGRSIALAGVTAVVDYLRMHAV